jgi:hypothetical protein
MKAIAVRKGQSLEMVLGFRRWGSSAVMAAVKSS